MPTGGRATLTQFLMEERRRAPGATSDLNAPMTDGSLARNAVPREVAHGALGGVLDNHHVGAHAEATCRVFTPLIFTSMIVRLPERRNTALAR